MSKIYTANDFIRFIYQETNAADSANLQKIIDEQPEAAEMVEQFTDVVNMLDGISMHPSPTSVALILEAAHKSTAEFI
jgi:hypothetical protein